MLLSETDEVGRAETCRSPVGLKSPGEDMGVLLADLKGSDGAGGMCVWRTGCEIGG